MLNQVETLVQLEQSPNLYWALASLPASLSEMTTAVQFEASILARVFPQLAQLPSEDVEPSVWQRRLASSLEEMIRYSQSSNSEANATNAQLLAGLTLIVFDHPSRQQLIESGMDKDVVREMTAAEAVAYVINCENRLGLEVIIPRRIEPDEIYRIRKLPQTIGWKYYPESHGRRPCGCPYCQRGEYGARKLRENYERS